EDYICYELLEFIADSDRRLLKPIHAAGDAIEGAVFPSTAGTTNVHRLYTLRRDLLRLRNVAVPLIEVCHRLERAEAPIDPAMHPLFRDLSDHLVRVAGEIDAVREGVAFPFEAGLMRGQGQLNAITRKARG